METTAKRQPERFHPAQLPLSVTLTVAKIKALNFRTLALSLPVEPHRNASMAADRQTAFSLRDEPESETAARPRLH